MPLPLASVAEELAARAIMEEAKSVLQQEEEMEQATSSALQQATHELVNEERVRRLLAASEEEVERTDEDDDAEHAPAFADWVRPFSKSSKHRIHPYVWEVEQATMVGQAYKACLSRWEREMLSAGIVVLLDEVFEDLMLMESREPKEIAETRLGWYLPRRYLPRYTWQFFKQFVVCLMLVGWKLVQTERQALSSVAEELVTNAIIEAAQDYALLEQEAEGGVHKRLVTVSLVDDLQEVLLEDTDFEFLFDDEYDGIEQTLVGEMLGMSSLSFEDWFKPFSSDPARLAHPYVMHG